jgi:hypothetical protein
VLTIRKDQMRVIAQTTLEEFEEKLSVQITEDFKADAAALGAEKLKSTVHGGVEKALGYGFETEQELSRYLYLMFTFGAGFDQDAALPWAAETLASAAPPKEKMQQLYDKAQEFEYLGRGITTSS